MANALRTMGKRGTTLKVFLIWLYEAAMVALSFLNIDFNKGWFSVNKEMCLFERAFELLHALLKKAKFNLIPLN